MAETTLLKAEEREETGKSQARLIRKNGQIPCIIYGDKKYLSNLDLNQNKESIIKKINYNLNKSKYKDIHNLIKNKI